MKRYDILILNELIDKYEHSKLSKEGSNKDLHISIKASHAILKDYWSEESYLYRDQINMTLDELIKKKFISIRLNRNKELDLIYLNIEYVSDIYKSLKRSNPENRRAEALVYLESLNSDNSIVRGFIIYVVDRLSLFQSVQSYFDSLDDLKLYIKAIETMVLLEEDTLIRNFSKKVFNDSKLFENIEHKVLKIIRDFSDDDVEDDDELLSNYHLVKTPTFAYMKGGIIIKVKDQMIDLNSYGHELAFSSSAILDLDIIDISVNKVITIENLTTFISFDSSEYIIIYLGGFHNSVKRKLLNKIWNFDNNIKFYHFGDIDAGGLLIFEDLVIKTGIQFVPHMMDVATLVKYKEFWIQLTQNDKKRLKKISKGRFSQLINFMLVNNCKLEQEAIQKNDSF